VSVEWQVSEIPGGLELRLSGKIDEKFDIAPVVSAARPAKRVAVRLSGLRAISSLGMRTFEGLVGALRDGRELSLVEVSPALATQLTLIPNLCAGARVESAWLPFACPSCGAEVSAAVPWKSTGHIEAAPTCECGAKMELDGLPEQYLP
jgi:anti-anti-sigma regulatory factor